MYPKQQYSRILWEIRYIAKQNPLAQLDVDQKIGILHKLKDDLTVGHRECRQFPKLIEVAKTLLDGLEFEYIPILPSDFKLPEAREDIEVQTYDMNGRPRLRVVQERT